MMEVFRATGIDMTVAFGEAADLLPVYKALARHGYYDTAGDSVEEIATELRKPMDYLDDDFALIITGKLIRVTDRVTALDVMIDPKQAGKYFEFSELLPISYK